MTQLSLIPSQAQVGLAFLENPDQLIIAGREIRQDKHGLYCLNDFQAAAIASGVTKDIRPHEWLDMQQTRETVNILITENPVVKPVRKVTGRYGGTYVCKELVYSYAMWVSAEFHLLVIRTFDVVVNNRLYWKAARQGSKEVRKELTDAIQALQPYAITQGSTNPDKLYINYTGLVYDVLNIPRPPTGMKNYRDTLSALQNNQLGTIECVIAIAIHEGMANGEDYHDIYKLAKQRALAVATPMLAYMGAGTLKNNAVGVNYALQ